jgi:proliferating cell nuclear antigen
MEWLAPPVDETAPVEAPTTPEPTEVVFGIDVDKVAEALRRAKGPVWFRILDDWDRPRAEVLFGAEKRTMSLVDTDGMADPRVPVLNLPASFAVSGDVLMEAVKSCASISDHVRLTIEADGTGLGAPVFTVLAQGDVDTWSASYQDEVEWVKRTGDKHTSLFPLDYLTNVLKTVKQNRLTISLGTDYPIRLDWEGVTKGTVLVAPRIESA